MGLAELQFKLPKFMLVAGVLEAKLLQSESLSSLIHSIASWANLVARALFLEKFSLATVFVVRETTPISINERMAIEKITSNKDCPKGKNVFFLKIIKLIIFLLNV